MIDESRTFFCSELVAKAFKELGILMNDNTSCAKFFPHDFSAKGDSFLKFTPGTIIEEELQVILDKNREKVEKIDETISEI